MKISKLTPLLGLFLSGLMFFLMASTSVLAQTCVICPTPPPNPTNKKCCNGCTAVNQCVSNKTCTFDSGLNMIGPWGGECGSALIGGINPPQGVSDFNQRVSIQQGTGQHAVGIFLFVTIGLRLFFIIAGLLIFGNFIYSGFLYITQAGNSKAHTDVRERVTYSIIGLVIMISAFILASIIGSVVFGDPEFILNPSITEYSALNR